MTRRVSLLAILLLLLSCVALGQNSVIGPAAGVLEDHIELVLMSVSGDEISVPGSRLISNRSLPLFVEYDLDETRDLQISWDFNQLEDADWDGQFRNDRDATGLQASYIYNTNRTPFVITVTAIAADGITYVGSDEISFVIQAGDEVELSATDPSDNAEISGPFTWTSLPDDPLDSNWRITSADGRTWLSPAYPGTCSVQAETADKAVMTDLFVFNPTPDFLEIKGVAFNSATRPYTELGNVQRHLESLGSLGFNWLEITYATLYESSNNSFSIVDTTYGPYEPEASSGDTPYYDKTVQVINMAHDAGFDVSLNLHLWDRPGQSRWLIAPTSTFFRGKDGYFSFVEEGIKLANEASVEMLVANNELGSLARSEARPFLMEEIELLDAGLVASAYTFSNFFDPGGYPSGRPYPRPWDENYGTPLGLLNSIGFSSYRGIASTWTSGLAEMQATFANQQIANYSATHAAWEDHDLHVFISELGYPNVDGGATDDHWQIEGGRQDHEEQRRAVAATLRALYDLVEDGDSYFDGIFWWDWVVDTDEALAYNLSTSFRFNARPVWPSLNEIYCFWNSAPQKVIEVPLLFRRFGAATYLDPLLDVRAVTGYEASRIVFIQEFGSFSAGDSVLTSYGALASNVGLSTISVSLDQDVSGLEGASIRLDYVNSSGEGGEALVYPRLELPYRSFTANDYISLRVRRSDSNIGLAWVIHDARDHNGDTFVQRVPIQPSSEWQTIVLPLDDFSKGSTGNEEDTAATLGRSRLDQSNVALFLYSIDGTPVEGMLWIDAIGVGH